MMFCSDVCMPELPPLRMLYLFHGAGVAVAAAADDDDDDDDDDGGFR